MSLSTPGHSRGEKPPDYHRTGGLDDSKGIGVKFPPHPNYRFNNTGTGASLRQPTLREFMQRATEGLWTHGAPPPRPGEDATPVGRERDLLGATGEGGATPDFTQRGTGGKPIKPRAGRGQAATSAASGAIPVQGHGGDIALDKLAPPGKRAHPREGEKTRARGGRGGRRTGGEGSIRAWLQGPDPAEDTGQRTANGRPPQRLETRRPPASQPEEDSRD